ncbi:hypothetical protein ACHAW6_015645, partial [Cyclotella cf. meneghiniana]
KTIPAADTNCGKLSFEHEAANVNVKVKEYHSDNGVFNSSKFGNHCKALGQWQKFQWHWCTSPKRVFRTCHPNDHQHGLCEYVACCFALALSKIHHPVAIDMKCYLNGWTHEELWAQLKNPVSGLSRAHVFECPVYVLDLALQDGHKIPKWDAQAWQGIFVCFSMEISTSVPLVLNHSTGHITPSTMWCLTMPSPQLLLSPLSIFDTSMETYLDPSHDDLLPGLSEEWLTPDDVAAHQLSHSCIEASSAPFLPFDSPGDSQSGPVLHPIHLVTTLLF